MKSVNLILVKAGITNVLTMVGLPTIDIVVSIAIAIAVVITIIIIIVIIYTVGIVGIINIISNTITITVNISGAVLIKSIAIIMASVLSI